MAAGKISWHGSDNHVSIVRATALIQTRNVERRLSGFRPLEDIRILFPVRKGRKNAYLNAIGTQLLPQMANPTATIKSNKGRPITSMRPHLVTKCAEMQQN